METTWIAEATQDTLIVLSAPLMSIANKDELKLLQKVIPNTTLKDTDVDELFDAGTTTAISETRRTLSTPRKMWRDSGDKKVRSSHRLTNGQVQPVTEPFQLPGGLVMIPGDGSLGASLTEIIGCRCTVIYL
jgi:uncharacterized protein with gpF-like domain